MPNIIVTSGGFNDVNNYVSDENKELFKKIAEGKRVLIIANAAPEGTGNYIARENVKENFLKVGATKVDILDVNQDNVTEILNYDVVYGLGGDIGLLIKLNQETDFKSVLLEFLKTGVYIGESAGSMILADSVKYAYDIKRGTKPKYDVILPTYEGLGLIDIYIYPHFQKAKEDMIVKTSNYEKENNITITRLNDGDVIFYDYVNRKDR